MTPHRIAVACLVFTALLLSTPSAGADVIVVDGTSVDATAGDDAFTADLKLFNVGAEPVSLSPTLEISPDCTATVKPTVLDAVQSTKVTLTFDEACFGESKSLVADIDATATTNGPLPAITIKKPDPARDWAPLQRGAGVGLAVAGVYLLVFLFLKFEANNRLCLMDAGEAHEERVKDYQNVKDLVDARMAELDVDRRLTWKPLQPPEIITLRSEVVALEAGWSFKDSWVANLTVATGALFALATSVDALTALLGDEPKGALGVMTVTGLVSAIIIAVANTVVKLLGKSTAAVTVAGLLVSSTLVVFAASMQTVTVGIAVSDLIDDDRAADVARFLTFAVTVVLAWYAVSAVSDSLNKTAADSLPTVPADALTAWKATTAGESRIVIDQIRSTYATWLVDDEPVATASYRLLYAPAGFMTTSPGDGIQSAIL
jgi:hypothetical protein